MKRNGEDIKIIGNGEREQREDLLGVIDKKAPMMRRKETDVMQLSDESSEDEDQTAQL